MLGEAWDSGVGLDLCVRKVTTGITLSQKERNVSCKQHIISSNVFSVACVC